MVVAPPNSPASASSDGKVTIRPFLPGDARAVYDAVQESLQELPIWMPYLNANLTEDEIRQWIDEGAILWAEGERYDFAIVDARDGAFLGGCGLSQFHPGHGFANLYYWVRSTRTGQGVASGAARLLARFGIEKLGLTRVEILMATGNLSSARVAQKAGATYEGTLRNRIRIDDTLHDAFIYSLIPSDFS